MAQWFSHCTKSDLIELGLPLPRNGRDFITMYTPRAEDVIIVIFDIMEMNGFGCLSEIWLLQIGSSSIVVIFTVRDVKVRSNEIDCRHFVFSLIARSNWFS